MSDNVNVLIDKMNQESLKKRRVPVGARAIGTTGQSVSGGISAQGDDIGGVSVDDNGSKPYGAVSNAGRSVRKG